MISILLANEMASAVKAQEDNTLIYARTKGKSIRYESILSYCAPCAGISKKRDSLSQEEQLRKIALAQQKRERKKWKSI